MISISAAAALAVLAAWALRRAYSAGRDAAASRRRAEELSQSMASALGELSRDKAQLTAILSSIVEGVLAVDGQGRVIAANPSLCALLALDEKAILGRPFLETIRHARLSELVSTVIKERRFKSDEVALLSPEERVFEAHAVPLKSEGPSGALLVLHDITQLRKLERMRRDFVANVSHELRTPLASIKGFAETLREGAIDDKKHRVEFLEEIEHGAEQLAKLVDDLLDLSAMEAGQRAPAPESLDALEIAREAAAALKPLSERRRISVSVATGPAPARADRSQLRRILVNLIDNAIKYNKDGGSVLVAAGQVGKFLEVSVSDRGAGIPLEDLPRVFERFYRVEKARSRESGGTGLGLSIVKHLVELGGGKIMAESKVGEGSTFRFTLTT